MLNTLPTNVIPSFLIGLSSVFFGIRGLLHYRRLRSPLSLYYSLCALFVGISALFYSLPFVFTQADVPLKTTTIIGDLFYYATAVMCGRIIWYLGLKKRVAFGWVLAPILAICTFSLIVFVVDIQQLTYQVVDGLADYPIPPFSSWLMAFITLLIIIVAVLTIIQAKVIEDARQRYRLYSIGIAFGLGGIFAIINFLFFQGNNSSPISIIGYIVAASILFFGLVFVSRRSSR